MSEDMSFPALLGVWARAVRVAGKLLPSLCMLAQCTGAPGAATGEADPMIDPAVRAAVAVGQTRVIVELHITPAFRPEGDLPGAAAVEAQRKAITKAQADVLARLGGARFALVRQYDSLPTLALEIDADALDHLEAAGDVVARVLPDRRRLPQSEVPIGRPPGYEEEKRKAGEVTPQPPGAVQEDPSARPPALKKDR